RCRAAIDPTRPGAPAHPSPTSRRADVALTTHPHVKGQSLVRIGRRPPVPVQRGRRRLSVGSVESPSITSRHVSPALVIRVHLHYTRVSVCAFAYAAHQLLGQLLCFGELTFQFFPLQCPVDR